MHNPYPYINDRCNKDVAPIATAIRRFIEATLEYSEGWIGLSSMPNGEPPRTAWADACDSELLTTLAIRASNRNVVDHWGVHLNMSPRRGRPASGRGGDKDILNFPCFWVDIDDAPPDTLEVLHAFKPAPSIVSMRHGGGGYHAIWCLEQPVPYTPQTVRIMLSLVKQFRGGDLAASRPSSMLRIPGTWNHKPDRGGLVEVIDWSYERLYKFDQFLWLDPGVEVARPRHVNVEEDNPDKQTVTAAEVAAMCRNAKPYKGGWLVSCPNPNHGKGRGDQTPGMTVHQGETAVLIRCFGGCELRVIVESLGLEMSALFSGDSRPATRTEMRAMFEATRED